MADFADRAVAIVGRYLDQDGDAARAVAFKRDLFVSDAGQLAGAALDGALDVVGRHVLGLGRGHRGAQARILFRDRHRSWPRW